VVSPRFSPLSTKTPQGFYKEKFGRAGLAEMSMVSPEFEALGRSGRQLARVLALQPRAAYRAAPGGQAHRGQ